MANADTLAVPLPPPTIHADDIPVGLGDQFRRNLFLYASGALLLFGQQTAAQLSQRSAKERLQEQALAEVRGVLKAERAPAKVEAVFFTSLVTQ